MKVGFGAGLIICFLLPIVLLLFGVLGVAEAAAGILLLGGLWGVVYGIMFAKDRDRFYDVGFGIVVAVLSTFDFLPLQYVLGLVLLSVIGIVVSSMTMGRKKP